jgi:hypothetical protein
VLWDSKLPEETAEENFKQKPFEVHRLKAKLPISDGQIKIVQGVREVFEILDAPNTEVSLERDPANSSGKIVLIGRDLVGVLFSENFAAFIKSD